ncbi:VOC family protein [Leekyejoonella antrihumi]|uniref:Glyoxalase n=1 Tax=Leekyejoonella antrihumi TaxID=1660198 RepID=A0A563E8Y0_9MICO|nr:VOC family protein [Leekyejoonella antrihumi]TWP38976.1 glyoxalase [Leekyejoonella antrihumi]
MNTDDKATEPSTTRPDHNIWTGLTYADVPTARGWLRDLGFTEGIVVKAENRGIQHSEMLWPEGGRVMLSSRDTTESDFSVNPGAASSYVVTDDPDAVWQRAQRLGAQVVREMRDEDYGSRGFSIKDGEGNRWSFGTYAG